MICDKNFGKYLIDELSSDYHVFSLVKMRKIKTKAELKSVGGLANKSEEDMAPFGTCGLCYKVILN